ncbi:MAG: CoA pyrophosphatase [Desulfocapsaceae bacterium]|nr:CoA pyrophosphatase [Desulfocapsaceae bacterium]
MKENDFKTFIAGLPAVPGILGRDLYFNSAVLVPFVLVGDDYHLLFQKRAAGIRQGHEICFPGGGHDEAVDLNFQETAIRETMEELGLPRKKITISGRLDTLVTPRGFIVETFIGTLAVKDLTELRPAVGEVAEIFTIPVSWFIDNEPEIYFTRVEMQPSSIGPDGKKQIFLPVDELGLPAIYGRNREGMKYRVVVYKTGKHLIWGLTAAIVYEMIGKIRSAGAGSATASFFRTAAG